MQSILSRAVLSNYRGDTSVPFDNVMATPVGRLAAYSHEHSARALPALEICSAVPATKKAKRKSKGDGDGRAVLDRDLGAGLYLRPAGRGPRSGPAGREGARHGQRAGRKPRC